jgi:SAM-dependent methyltransferase
MNEYVLPHDLSDEEQRLALMSQLLDSIHRNHLERLGLQPGWRCLEIGSGNGSISQWLAGRVAPGGFAVATDLDVRLIEGLRAPNLEVRRLNILEDPLEENAFDLVTARAVLHHIHSPERAVQRMVTALRPGGVLLSIEPDLFPATAAEPESARAFWQGWLKWSASMGIDYFVGKKMPGLLDAQGFEAVGAEGHTAVFNGASPWANYFVQTVRELRESLLQSGFLNEAMIAEFQRLYANPRYWTSVMTFVAVWGRKAGMPS